MNCTISFMEVDSAGKYRYLFDFGEGYAVMQKYNEEKSQDTLEILAEEVYTKFISIQGE